MKHLKKMLALILFMGATTFGYSQSSTLKISNKSRCNVVIDRVYVMDCAGSGQFIYPNLCVPAGTSAGISPVASASHEWAEVVACIADGCDVCPDFGSCIDQPSPFPSCANPLPPYTISGCECSATVEFVSPNVLAIY
ncbi:MAG TPA: hypothetical protein DCG19_02140 [Cryomorphaceae bacterium]|nr:hypothetical protein [Owenweeksia sp.]MBF99383.1 hypothetical protein [Owenweeksia sp.]HAD96172.1 hypothetical protein [Cryomorphaceae bacterium]HBF19457.1 hypothetical protein [Cryomorphaceae bacterium]HCQ16811.1 hypothetical protein [Cryomorphaceae bacterium]|tara:strand:+ start:4706 stop:5119 length:414 start_codon:yes stop_codon:yes gene_type:complete